MKEIIYNLIDESLYRGVDPKILKLDIQSLSALEKDLGFNRTEENYTLEQFLGLKIELEKESNKNKVYIEIK